MLWWFAQNAVLAGLLAAVVASACRIGRFRPAVRHALWLVVLLKLATPPVFTWPGVALIFDEIPEAPAESPIPSEPEPIYQILVPVQHDSIVSLVAPEAPAAIDTGAAEPSGDAASRSSPPSEGCWRWPGWLAPAALRVVLTGAVLLALVHGIRIARLRRLLAVGRPAPVPLTL